MRVVHFCGSFSRLSETFIYDSIIQLQRHGVDNHVLTLRQDNADIRPFDQVHVVRGPSRIHPSTILNRVCAKLGARMTDNPSWPVLRRRLRPSVEELSPDVIHAHFGFEAVIISSVAADLGIPLIVTFYGYDISQLPREPVWQQRYARLWTQTQAVIVLSDHMRGRALQLQCPSEKLHVVHLVRSLNEHRPPRTGHSLHRFVTVGRLVEKKGHEDTIRAFHSLCVRHPAITLDIVGDGPEQKPLQKLVRTFGLAGRIRFHGALPTNETLKLIANSDAFVLSSRTARDGDEEGTPTVLLEAQMLGVPCVATWHAGIPETIPPENRWLLAREGNVTEIADRMEALIRQSNQQLQDIVDRAQQYVKRNFDPSFETNKLIQFYESAMRSRSAWSSAAHDRTR